MVNKYHFCTDSQNPYAKNNNESNYVEPERVKQNTNSKKVIQCYCDYQLGQTLETNHGFNSSDTDKKLVETDIYKVLENAGNTANSLTAGTAGTCGTGTDDIEQYTNVWTDIDAKLNEIIDTGNSLLTSDRSSEEGKTQYKTLTDKIEGESTYKGVIELKYHIKALLCKLYNKTYPRARSNTGNKLDKFIRKGLFFLSLIFIIAVYLVGFMKIIGGGDANGLIGWVVFVIIYVILGFLVYKYHLMTTFIYGWVYVIIIFRVISELMGGQWLLPFLFNIEGDSLLEGVSFSFGSGE
jgi:hypothetical protein